MLNTFCSPLPSTTTGIKNNTHDISAPYHYYKPTNYTGIKNNTRNTGILDSSRCDSPRITGIKNNTHAILATTHHFTTSNTTSRVLKIIPAMYWVTPHYNKPA